MLEKYQQIPFWQKLLAVLGVLIIVVFLYYNYSHKPKEEEISRLERQLNNLLVENTEARKMENELPNLEANIQQLEFTLRHLTEILPTDREIDTFLTGLHQTALKNNLIVSEYRKQPDSAYQEFLIRVPMRYRVSGQYHDLRRFFEALATTTRIVNIMNLDLQIQARSRDARGGINASFDLTTFRFKADHE